MAAQQFLVKNGLKAEAQVTFSGTGIAAGSQDTNGKVLAFDSSGNIIYRTSAQIKSDIAAGITNTITGGNGITVGTGTAADATVSMTAPGGLSSVSTSAADGSGHTHAITASSDQTARDGTGDASLLEATNAGLLSLKSLVVGTGGISAIGGRVLVDDATQASSATDGSLQTDGGLSVVKNAYIGGTATIIGDLTVSGTTTTVSTTNTLIQDKLITLNDGGTASSASGSGIELEENDAITGYIKTSGTRQWTMVAPENASVLTFDINASKTLTVGGALSIEADSIINQDLSSDSTAATFGTLTISTSLIPDASGGADLGSTSAEWGDVYIGDDKKIYLGAGQDASLEYDEDGTDQLRITGSTIFEDPVALTGGSLFLGIANTQFQSFYKSVAASAPATSVFTFKAGGTATAGSNYGGAKCVIGFNSGTAYHTREVLIHNNNPSGTLAASDVLYTEYGSLGGTVSDTLSVAVTAAGGGTYSSGDKYISLQIANASGTNAMKIQGTATMFRVPA